MMKKFIHKESSGSAFSAASIRTRLLLIMVLLMFVSLSLLTWVSYYFSNKALTKSVNENAMSIGADYSNRVHGFINELVLYVQDVAVNPHIVNPRSREQIVVELADALQRNNKFTGITYCDLNGNVIRAQGDTVHLSDREYYQKAVRIKKTVVSEPILSKGSGKLSIIIAVPVVTNGEVTAIIQATMPLDSLIGIVKNIKFMDNGYGFIIDQSGIIIAHSQRPELNGKASLVENHADPVLAKTLPEMDDQLVRLFHIAADSSCPVSGTYNVSNEAMFTVFTPVELPGSARWLVAVSAPVQEVTSVVSRMNFKLTLTALSCIAAGILVIFLISKRFARPEERYFKAFRHVADVIGIVNLENEKILEVNDAFFKVLGYQREDAVDHTCETLGLWENNDKLEVYASLKQGVSVHNLETFWTTKDKKRKIGVLSADVIKIGNEQYAVFIWHDISRQKEAETALRKAYDVMGEKVEERTQELFAANQELRAINEEMIAINEEMEQSNTKLHTENYIRRQAEEKLLLRERQYRATTNLLMRPAEEAGRLAETVLGNAIQLVEATGGFIGMYSEAGDSFVIHYGIGLHEGFSMDKIRVEASGPFRMVYETGEVFRDKEYWWNSNLPEGEGPTTLGSMIFVPLKQQEKVKGILAATWSAQYAVSDENVEVLQQFADLAFFAMERAQIQEQIRHIAFYDVLTDLPNRVSLNMRLADELEKARRGEAEGILFFIDMDDFKTVNDTFGHSAGDKVIVTAGRCLKNAFNESAFVSHISGDEFIVIVSGDATIEKATQLASRVLAKLCREYDVVEKQIQLSASIGVVLYPQHGNMPEDLLKKADAAMYVAKAAGRNCWRFFEPELLKKTAEDTLLINSLRRALPRNEFFLQYQPQMTADGGDLVGLEALLRWNSPEHGFVSPARFIPLAERSRLIVEIGHWVFVQACCFAKKLADMGKSNLRVAVNISPRQIKDDDFVSRVRAVIEASGILPEQIELEVTETVLMENLEDGVPKLRELQQDGVNLALDDFGTGFSSLTYLRTLPVNCLKIDKSFIDGIAFDQMQMRFVESIINLGHTLEMEIVAEGVETKEQLEHLVNCHCDYIQGYVFSKPISEAEALKLCQGFSSSAKKE